MTADIVERLIDRQRRAKGNRNTPLWSLLGEAAREIKRLRRIEGAPAAETAAAPSARPAGEVGGAVEGITLGSLPPPAESSAA
jgi:hypothetical protein